MKPRAVGLGVLGRNESRGTASHRPGAETGATTRLIGEAQGSSLTGEGSERYRLPSASLDVAVAASGSATEAETVRINGLHNLQWEAGQPGLRKAVRCRPSPPNAGVAKQVQHRFSKPPMREFDSRRPLSKSYRMPHTPEYGL